MTSQRARRISRTWTIAWLIAVVLLAPAMVVAATTPDGAVGWVAALPPVVVLWLGLWKSIYYGGWADGYDAATEDVCDEPAGGPLIVNSVATLPLFCERVAGHRGWHRKGETCWRYR